VATPHGRRKVCRQLVGDTAKALRKELLSCGMMTQNGVTHTAMSKAAEKYRVAILTDCCTTVNAMLQPIALHAVSARVRLVESRAVL
jgi:nicotinamidase-related amidase